MLTTIYVERRESFNPADKEKIMSAVQSTCGFAKFNTMVFEKMRDCAFQTLEDATFERQENGRLRDLEAYKYTQGLLRLGLGDAGEAVCILLEFMRYTPSGMVKCIDTKPCRYFSPILRRSCVQDSLLKAIL